MTAGGSKAGKAGSIAERLKRKYCGGQCQSYRRFGESACRLCSIKDVLEDIREIEEENDDAGKKKTAR